MAKFNSCSDDLIWFDTDLFMITDHLLWVYGAYLEIKSYFIEPKLLQQSVVIIVSPSI